MKKCPQCGFEGTPSNRRVLKLFSQYFPGLPVGEMISRGWIHPKVYSQWLQRGEWCNDEIPQMLSEVLLELRKFFQCETVDELKEKLGWTGDLMDRDTANLTPEDD